MRIAIDTSVAVPLLATGHRAHGAVKAWARGRSLAIPAQALAETYSVLTRLPGDARLSPEDAARIIDASFGDVIAVDDVRQRTLHRELASRVIAGGAVYDALVAFASADQGLSLATRDARARATYEAVGVRVDLVA